MKRSDIITSLVLVPVDYLMLLLAGISSYGLRFQGIVTDFRPVFFDYPFSEFFPLLLVVSAVGIIIFALNGSYKITSKPKMGSLFSKSFFGVSTTLLMIIVAIFLQRELFSSRFVIISAWVLAIVYVFLARVIVYRIKQSILAHGKGVQYLVLIGLNKASDDIRSFYASNPQLGYRVSDVIRDFSDKSKERIISLKSNKRIDELLDVRKTVDKDELVEILNFSHEHDISFRYLAHAQQTRLINFEIDSIGGYPVIQVNKSPLQGWGAILKRSIDIIVSVLMIIVLSPAFLVISILVKTTTKGPAIVKLRRVGKNGNIFELYKFRSMLHNSHELKYDEEFRKRVNERSDGPLFKTQNDPRITPLGKWLRKTSLDELPQLINVLLGAMSLVGPRPHEPEEVAQYEKEYRTLIGSRPGITGLSQVSGRSNLLFSEEVTLDLFYIENWSLKLDIQILLKTIIVVFKVNEAV